MEIYKYIDIDINGEQIYPTRGIPQGSVYGPLMFEIYIKDILTNIQSMFKEVHIQCFVDDIYIMSNTKNNLEKAFEVVHQMIINKKMELNIDKCEYLSPEEDDTFIDPITKNIIPKKDKVKYLGQVINQDGTATDPLNAWTYGTISQLLHNTTEHLSKRSRIKLYKTFIKAKFTHLIPLLSVSDKLEKSWKTIRSVIFRDIIQYSTMPKESSALYGLSYYNIIIRSLIKIILTAVSKNNEEYINFLYEATKKAFTLWTNFEKYHNEKILNLIDKVIKDSTMPPLEEWDKLILEDAANRLFKNCIIPEKIINISKQKVPRLIELLSNAPIHIITQEVSNFLLKKQQNNECEKCIKKHILNYIIMEKTIDIPEIDLPKPLTNNIKELIEYQNIYQFHIQKITISKYDEAYKEAVKMTNAMLQDKYTDKKNITIKAEHLNRINQIREKITYGSKDYLIQWEEIFGFTNFKFINSNYKEEMKRKPGRPKNKENKNKDRGNQMSIENFFQN